MSQKGIPLTQQHRDRISAGVKAAWVRRKASVVAQAQPVSATHKASVFKAGYRWLVRNPVKAVGVSIVALGVPYIILMGVL